jgi:hypothetical protein
VTARRAARAALLAAVAGVAVAGSGPAATAQSTTTTTTTSGASSGGGAAGGVTLAGEGSNAPYKEITTWQNDLAGGRAPINLNYAATGSQQGRDDFLAGTADFAISGTQFAGGSGAAAPCSTQATTSCAPGFTPPEIGQLPHQTLGRDVIAAPVAVTALAFILALPLNTSTPGAPQYGFDRQDQFCDPTTGQCDPNQPLNTPVTRGARVPNVNLSAMVLNLNLPDPNKADTWGSNVSDWNAWDVLNAMGVQPPQCDPSQNFIHCFAGMANVTKPVSVVQSEPDELNYYLQTYIRSTALTIWTSNKAATPGIDWECTASQQFNGQCVGGDLFERMPRVPNLSRQGADQGGDQLTIPGGTAGNTAGGSLAGAIGALPPTSLTAAPLGIQNGTPLQFIGIQNKNGDWVTPSPTSIDAAVNAGNGTPLYAMTHSVANAYPLTWVDYLYVKSSGLSAEKTEALATLVRYLATDGQAAARPWGEGTLSSALVADALKAANQVVQSNCPSAHGTIVSSTDPGSDAPATPGIHAIGAMLHCVPPPAAPGAAAGGSGAPAGLSLSGAASLPTTPALPTPAQAPTKRASTATPLPTDVTADKLPLPLPGLALDRFATFLLGALGFAMLRDPIRRRLGRSTE